MAEIKQFTRKTAASRGRVGALTATTVLALDRAQRQADANAEADRLRQRLVHDLTWAARKMYATLGFDGADTLVQLALSSVREEQRMKQKIKGESSHVSRARQSHRR